MLILVLVLVLASLVLVNITEPFQAKINNQKCCRQVRFSSPKYTKMRLRHAGLQWFTGAASRQGKGRGNGKGSEGGKEKVEHSPHFFLTI